MSILKLEKHGEKALLDIASVEKVEGNYGPQFKFTGANGDLMFVNEEPCLRQLSRLGLSPELTRGATLEFERVIKDGKRFMNINKPGAAKVASEKQAFSSGPALPYETNDPQYPELPHEKLDKLFGLYGAIESHVLATSVPKWTKADVGTTPESVAAQVATIFIQACK